MGSPDAIQPPITLPTRPSSIAATAATAPLRTAAAISGVVGGVAIHAGDGDQPAVPAALHGGGAERAEQRASWES